jgi:hypothetical protein
MSDFDFTDEPAHPSGRRPNRAGGNTPFKVGFKVTLGVLAAIVVVNLVVVAGLVALGVIGAGIKRAADPPAHRSR